jgi:hypothetical protein
VPRSETPVSANAIQRALEALGRTIDQQAAEIEHYRRELAAERAARHDLEVRLRRAQQYTPTVALTLPPATRPDLYATVGQGAA